MKKQQGVRFAAWASSLHCSVTVFPAGVQWWRPDSPRAERESWGADKPSLEIAEHLKLVSTTEQPESSHQVPLNSLHRSSCTSQLPMKYKGLLRSWLEKMGNTQKVLPYGFHRYTLGLCQGLSFWVCFILFFMLRSCNKLFYGLNWYSFLLKNLRFMTNVGY